MTLYRKAVVAAVALLLVASVAMSINSIATTVPVVADMNTLPTIVIDAGHGGADGGAVGVGGEIEKDINLNIALLLRDLFLVNGYEVVMTRDTDISIHDNGVEGLRKQKTSDLNNRLDIVNTYPNAVFISVHQNKFGDSSSHGMQVFYSPNNELSEGLALAVQQTTVELLQPDNQRKVKEAGKNLYLMYEAQCPAVLVECGFLSNPDEAGQLAREEYQAQLAFAIFYSVCGYIQPEPEPAAVIY